MLALPNLAQPETSPVGYQWPLGASSRTNLHCSCAQFSSRQAFSSNNAGEWADWPRTPHRIRVSLSAAFLVSFTDMLHEAHFCRTEAGSLPEIDSHVSKRYGSAHPAGADSCEDACQRAVCTNMHQASTSQLAFCLPEGRKNAESAENARSCIIGCVVWPCDNVRCAAEQCVLILIITQVPAWNQSCLKRCTSECLRIR